MAPTLNATQSRGLMDFLGSHQKIHLLMAWVNARVRAEELKIDVSAFKQMRKEKVLPKRLGRAPSMGSELEPFSAREDHAVAQLIKDKIESREVAFARAAERWSTLTRNVSPLLDSRPSLLNDVKAFCNVKLNKVKKDKAKKVSHSLKSLISTSKWEQYARPGAVVDMSGGRLSKIERQLLSFGLKFSTGLNEHTPLDVASALNKFRSRYANDPRVPDISFVRSSVIPYLDTERHTTLPDRYYRAISTLARKKDLTVVPADKGGAVCVLRTTKYYALGFDVLSDTNTFLPVEEDDVEGRDVTAMQTAHNQRISAIADRVKDKDMKSVINRLVSPPTPLMPTMQTNLKHHKDPVTARPVISNVSAPQSRSSKWAARHLSPHVGLISDAHIRNTRDFYEKVRRHKADERLLSLDVKSLFTNIPVQEAIDVVREYSTGPNPTIRHLPIEPELFCELLTVVTSFNQFTFGGRHFRQITGVPMGSSLSPVLANIFMEHFEQQLLDDIPTDVKPVLWLRYVDDVFCLYKDMSKFDDFLNILNGVNPAIQFTYELSRVERTVNGSADLPVNVLESLPFLELNVMRLDNGNFAFSIYRKPVHAGNYLHAFSHQPLSQKSTVIRSLYLRAYRFCDAQFLKEEEDRIKQSFKDLGYRDQFIEKC